MLVNDYDTLFLSDSFVDESLYSMAPDSDAANDIDSIKERDHVNEKDQSGSNVGV
jgi:hypothetical protein